jgi:hypothetical protein
LRATSSITAYYSDKRLKEIVGSIDNALIKLHKISGVYYNSNDTAFKYGYKDKKRQIGLLAQDVKEILPEVIRSAPFDLDEEGQSKSGENYMTITYERIVPLLIEALKEQKQQIELINKTLRDRRK